MDEAVYKNLSLEDLPGEEWRDVIGYESFYSVSNMGRIKSKTKNRIEKQFIVCGYLKVPLRNFDGRKMVASHRVTAMAFIPNRNNYPCINHRNEIKTDNRVVNLEWCDNIYNCNYGTRKLRISKTQRNCPQKSKRVLQYTLDGIFVKEWESIQEATRHGFDHKSISSCCAKKYGHRSTGGFLWKYADDNTPIQPYVNHHIKPVICYDLNMNFLKEYPSAVAACKELGLDTGSICECCKGRRGRVHNYIFKYK